MNCQEDESLYGKIGDKTGYGGGGADYFEKNRIKVTNRNGLKNMDEQIRKKKKKKGFNGREERISLRKKIKKPKRKD